jgi:hypothetical protein
MGPELYSDHARGNSDPGQMAAIIPKGDDPPLRCHPAQKKSGATQGWRPFLQFVSSRLPRQTRRQGNYMPLL